MTIFADTHCHLDLYPDMLQVAEECEQRALKTIAVTNLPSDWQITSKKLIEYRHIRVALGLHPQLVAEHGHELKLFLRLLAKVRYVGEVGLDGSKEAAASLPQQKKILEAIIQTCGEQEGKIITLHSRGAVKDVLDILGRWLPGKRNAVILHWFTGTPKQMLQAVQLGCYFSVNTQMVKSSSGQKLVSQIPQDRILTETDGPFINYGREPAKPWHVMNVVTSLAVIWKMDSQHAAEQVSSNFKAILKAVPLNGG